MPAKKKTTKKLTRGQDKVALGILSGIAEYIGMDPILVRLAWILITVFTGFVPGIVAYILAAVVIPEK